MIAVSEGKNSHSLAGKLINLFIQTYGIQRADLSVNAQIMSSFLKQTFRRTFVICSGANLCLAELIRGIEFLSINYMKAFIILKFLIGIFPQKLHQSLICGVTADYPVTFIIHRRRILPDGNPQIVADFRILFQFFEGNDQSVRREKFHDFQLSFCNRTGLVAEKYIQRSGSLDAFCFADKHIVVQHFAGILHKDNGNHQRKSFRNRADNNYDGYGYCIDQIH